MGEGAVAEIADAQGNVATYTGSSISLGEVFVAEPDESDGAVTAENNSIDIYGAGIEATSLDGFDQLNFHMVNDLATTSGPMISLDGPLPLYTLLKDSSSLSLYGEAVTDWAAFEGKEVTLISNTAGIYVLSDTLKENYDILDASGAIVATATLSVVGSSGGPQSLVVSNIQSSVPEPTTGTLSLLALAGLCIRRRK
ncbi:MAG: PEP-CTERM sorting domain-containing protein [Akkermansia sp.]|nr:PEP-CTERM sorting domain-containing protein [Akkermansia sp.]